MPVDYCVVVLPVLILIAFGLSLVGRRLRKPSLLAACGLLALFLLIYFLRGWVLWLSAQSGDRESQFELGNYYSTRLGYMWSDIEARDKWWLEAAKQGHRQAMLGVGYSSMFGTSKHIPKDLRAARKWLEAAQAAGHHDAPSVLKLLAEEEDKDARRS